MTATDDGGGLGRGRVGAGWGLAIVGSVALTGVLLPFREGESLSYEAVLFLGLAVACALVGGLGPALAASVLGTLLLNFFFTVPLHSFSIAGPGDVLTLIVFVVVSVAVSSVVDSAARRRHQATLAREEATTLGMLNRRLLGGEYDVTHLLDLVRETFAVDAVSLTGAPEPGHDASVAPAGRGLFLVVRGRALAGPERRVLDAFASHLGVLREREELARQTAAARELEAANRTRTALLTAVSHDLRTPLAGIRAAAETLRSAGPRLTVEDQETLLDGILDSTGRLTTIVVDLLDMSRLQTGAVDALIAPVDLGEIVARATRGVPGGERVEVGPLPAALADGVLLERALENLLANSVRYADTVRVVGEREGAVVLLRVVDDGPGVTPEDRRRMFEPFQRLGDAPQGEGVGLGLAVARGLTEAQGGSLTASATPGGGLTMTLTLRAVGA